MKIKEQDSYISVDELENEEEKRIFRVRQKKKNKVVRFKGKKLKMV